MDHEYEANTIPKQRCHRPSERLCERSSSAPFKTDLKLSYFLNKKISEKIQNESVS